MIAAFAAHWLKSSGVQMSRSGLMLGLLGTIAIGMPAGSATAQEYCVTCTSTNPS
jgi:hypothetical protein